MDEKTPQEPDGADGAEGQEPNREFDPEEIENDPARNPPDEELRDLKGG